ncbi:MAG TPA: 30S ribosomal protein S20 [Candidatus Limnocylindrales bacterium]|nr:30S ribosomal protein S20 [Candidatus Limnocylindrales bacterium]
MPLLKHAKKKLKQDKVRTIRNKKVKNAFKLSVKKAKEGASEKTVSAAFKAVDKAVKKNLIHKNRAARMKSSLSKLIGAKSITASKTTTPKKAEAKKAAKPTSKSKTTVKTKTVAKKSPKKK